jgi:hypothetical protein
MKYAQLIAAVANINGASFVGLDTHTDVTLTGGKKNPMQGRVTKRMTGATVMSFQNKNFSAYEAMVQRRLTAEGKDPEAFKLGERAWGTRVPNMPIVEHFKDGDTKYYLEVIFLTPGVVSYYLDGAPIAAADIIGLPVSKGGEQGGLTEKVILRTFAADSITELRIDGQVFN